MPNQIDDPGLAQAIADLVDRRVEDALRLKVFSEEIGKVVSVDSAGGSAIVMLKGRSVPNIAIADRTPLVDDRVLVRSDTATGIRYIAAIFGRILDESGGGGGSGDPPWEGLVWVGLPGAEELVWIE